MNKTAYICTNIEWDTDGDTDILDTLPQRIVIEVPVDLTGDEIEDHLSDTLSDETGWCHYGFDFQPL